jgi:hypothetical protein
MIKDPESNNIWNGELAGDSGSKNVWRNYN